MTDTIRSADLYAEFDDLDNTSWLFRWAKAGYLHPVEKRRGTFAGDPRPSTGRGSVGSVWPAWSRRMVPLLLARRSDGHGTTQAGMRRMLRDTANYLAVWPDDLRFVVSLDGGRSVPCMTDEALAGVLRGCEKVATIVAVPA